jgi:tetratricopeptide (TPR) repeat protein
MASLWLVIAAVAPSASLPPPDASILTGAAHAIQEGRLDQGRLMIAQAIRSGSTGTPVERLLADLAFASRNYDEALSRYKSLVAAGTRDAEICQKGATAALELGSIADAETLADCAAASPDAGWKAWNARGVVADFKRDWDIADRCYRRARELAPRQSEIVNNQGWSLLLRGDWAGALPRFAEAAALKPGVSRITNNLDLARSALAADLPRRRPGESDSEWAKRLNDAGVAARLLGDDRRALAAFTQALEASPVWFQRASDNLKALSNK